MSEQLPAPPGPIKLVALSAVGVCVGALAAAAFVLSYPAMHAFAVQAGISVKLAKGYPVIFDVLLVVILAAVLSLRAAGLPSRILAWVCLLVLLAAAAGVDALHADGRTIPSKTAAVTAAVVPWAVLLIAFGLLLAMLRHARLHRATAAVGRSASGLGSASGPGHGSAAASTTLAASVAQPLPAAGSAEPAGLAEDSLRAVGSVLAQPSIPDLAVAGQRTGSGADAVTGDPHRGLEQQPLVVPAQRSVSHEVPAKLPVDPVHLSGLDALDSALAADSHQDEYPDLAEYADSAQEAELGVNRGVAEETGMTQTAGPARESGVAEAFDPAEDANPAEDGGVAEDAGPTLDDPAADTDDADENDYSGDSGMPVFHRIWSSPTPPDSET
jgi:hypothetical protein